MLKIEKLNKSYGDYRVLDELSLCVPDGEIFGFVGPNGAGKTTTMKVLAGLIRPDSGMVFLDEVNLLKDTVLLKKSIGYMPDYFGIYDNLTACEYLEFYASTYGMNDKKSKKISYELLERLNLLHKADNYVDGMSRGEKQRLCLARCLVHDPKVLILDEPTSGLDMRTRMEFKSYLKELRTLNKTIILSSHILTELSEVCTSIGILEKGEMMMQGSMNEIVTRVDSSNPLLIQTLDNTKVAVEILKKNELVKTISVDGHKILVVFMGNEKDEAELLRELIEHQVRISSFNREQSSLESLFLKITGLPEENLNQ